MQEKCRKTLDSSLHFVGIFGVTFRFLKRGASRELTTVFFRKSLTVLW